MTEQERRALFFKVTGQVYALTSMGIYNAFCKGLEAGYEAGRKDENEACEKLHEEMWASSVSADSTVEAFNGALKNYARVIRTRREQ